MMPLLRQVIAGFWLFLSLVGTTSVYAEEQRCKELGANCVCSEPFNTNQYVRNGSAVNPSDSVNKQCTYEGNVGSVIARNTNDVVGTKESGIMSKLPPSRTIQYVLKAPEGFGGIYWIGHNMWKSGHQSSFLPRTSIRWYRYFSDNYAPDYTGSCVQGSKVAFNDWDNNPGSSYNILTDYGGHVYNFLNFSLPQDCCSAPIDKGITLNAVKGKWIRYELVTLKRGSQGFDQILYLKNVTDGLPEVTVFQLSKSTQLKNATSLTPPGILNRLSATLYREGTCSGYAAVSNFMIAGWGTDQGQRIGLAYEIEGNGNPGVSLNPPTNLRLLQ